MKREPNSPDLERFLAFTGDLRNSSHAELRDFFVSNDKIFTARAPGRIDVMGGIADYSGSLVLQMPTSEAAMTAVQENNTGRIRVGSLRGDDHDSLSLFSCECSDLILNGRPLQYQETRKFFGTSDRDFWAGYVAGVLPVLLTEGYIKEIKGLDILLWSNVPEAKGAASSAAIEVATMRAICELYGLNIPEEKMALLCQKVENLIVGSPCGIMDQMTSVLGKERTLLKLLCQPAKVCGYTAIPKDLAIWGIDSGVRHAVSGSDYGSVRIGAFMGYRMIADMKGLNVIITDENAVVNDPEWNGYLVNIGADEFNRKYREELPEKISGREFLEKFGASTDRVTSINPSAEYAVRIPAGHPVCEHERVKTFDLLLNDSSSEERNRKLGGLMYESHQSYTDCGLGCDATDFIVDLVRKEKGLYGARITGGGSGGTVAVLGDAGAADAIARVVDVYGEETGRKPYVFR